MANDTGEERILTLFADVHYYFSEPTPRPLSHRFDKASYVYLHQRSSSNGGRLEIANHVGKPEQDAFTGGLDAVTIRQTLQHPTLVTVTVDGYQSGPGASPPVESPEHHWHLPNPDPRPEGQFLFRLHTLDIYFWTAEDANSFVASLRKLLRPEQLDVPLISAANEQVMSPVVQKLENVAIQDSAYHDGHTRNSSSAIPSPKPQNNSPKTYEEVPTAVKSDDTATYQPLPYNPAAPPAPEKIAHREKTPPPPDAGAGTGLAAATHQDQSHSRFSSPLQPPNSLPHSAYGQPSGPPGYINPALGQTFHGSYAPPPPKPAYGGTSPQSHDYRNPSVSSSPYVPSPNAYNGVGAYVPPPPGSGPSQPPYAVPVSFAPPPKDPNTHLHGNDVKPPDSPATEILGNSYITPQPPLQHLQPQYADYLESRRRTEQPEYGYSNYQYDQSQHHQKQQSHGSNYDVHGETYRPTEAEAHKHKHQRPSGAGHGHQPGKLEQRAEKVERGLGRLLKKVEKKIG